MAEVTSSDLRHRGNRDGNALVEFALVLPLLLLVFAGIVDFGFLFQRYEVLTNAVREGARIAVLPSSYSDTVIQQRVTSYVTAGLGSSAGLTVAAPVRSTAGGLSTVRVAATLNYDYIILGPIVNLVTGSAWASSISLNAVSVMRTEVAP